MRNAQGSGRTTLWVPGMNRSYIRIIESGEGEAVVEFQNEKLERKQFKIGFIDLINMYGMNEFMRD